MNELPSTKGDVNINGRIFYVSQEPWIYSATIKENILFGKDFDQDKFTTVIGICALDEVFSVCELIEKGYKPSNISVGSIGPRATERR